MPGSVPRLSNVCCCNKVRKGIYGHKNTQQDLQRCFDKHRSSEATAAVPITYQYKKNSNIKFKHMLGGIVACLASASSLVEYHITCGEVIF